MSPIQSRWIRRFFFLLLLNASCSCQTKIKPDCESPGIRVPVSVAVIGDSRMFDVGSRDFGGFTNYLNRPPEQNAFKGTKFVFEDNDPLTASNVPGSDLYCSVANTALLAKRNFASIPLTHDAVLMSLGVNATGDPEGTKAAMSFIGETATQRGWLVFLTTIGPWKSYETWAPFYQNGTENINEWIRSTRVSGYVIIDSYKILEDANNPGTLQAQYSLDGLHYSVAGQMRIAEEANRVMAKATGCQR